MNQTRGESRHHSIQADSYNNHTRQHRIYEEEEEEGLDESQDTFEESEITKSGSSDEDSDRDGAVLEDMERFEQSFKGITRRYKLLNRIGEGMQPLVKVMYENLMFVCRNVLDGI